MQPYFPEVDEKATYVLSGATLAEIFREIRRVMPQGGEGIIERPAGDAGNYFDVDQVGTTGLSGKLTGVNDKNGFHFNYQPDPAGDSTTYYEVASLYITNGVITAYVGG